jgi:hypothetical protein
VLVGLGPLEPVEQLRRRQLEHPHGRP